MQIPGFMKIGQKQTWLSLIDVAYFKRARLATPSGLALDQGALIPYPTLASSFVAMFRAMLTRKFIGRILREKRLGLFCLLISLLLHLLVMLVMHAEPPKPQAHREVLIVEWGGVISNQQVEEKHQGQAVPPSEQQTPKEEVKEKPKKVSKTPRKPPTPQQVPEPQQNRPEPEQEQQQAQPTTSAAAPQGQDAQQIAQQLAARESELSLMRKYLAGLKQAIQNHLEYPQEAREPGNIGAAVILRFTLTETGDILPGSLFVSKSSGSSVLDAKALEAAQSAAPMQKPPRQMTVTITVVFAQD